MHSEALCVHFSHRLYLVRVPAAIFIILGQRLLYGPGANVWSIYLNVFLLYHTNN